MGIKKVIKKALVGLTAIGTLGTGFVGTVRLGDKVYNDDMEAFLDQERKPAPEFVTNLTDSLSKVYDIPPPKVEVIESDRPVAIYEDDKDTMVFSSAELDAPENENRFSVGSLWNYHKADILYERYFPNGTPEYTHDVLRSRDNAADDMGASVTSPEAAANAIRRGAAKNGEYIENLSIGKRVLRKLTDPILDHRLSTEERVERITPKSFAEKEQERSKNDDQELKR